MYYLGATDEEIPLEEQHLALREREVKAQEYAVWVELIKFGALVMVPIGAIFGIGSITKAVKRALT